MHSGTLQRHPVISKPSHRAETLHQATLLYVPPIEAERRMHRENVNNMPESSRETETEKLPGRQQRDAGNQSSHNIVSLISHYADDNLTLVRVGVSFVGHKHAIWSLLCSYLHQWVVACSLLVKEGSHNRQSMVSPASLSGITSCPQCVFDAPVSLLALSQSFFIVIVQHMFSRVDGITVILSTLNLSCLSHRT